MPLLNRLLRAGETKLVKRLSRIAQHIETLEPEVQELDDAALRAKTAEFQLRYRGRWSAAVEKRLFAGEVIVLDELPDDGSYGPAESLDELLPEAFAVVREAAVRTIGQRPFPVQLMGGAALHLGNIAEMKTGEGKTLTSVLPVYLNALAGDGVHVVTTNDYLAKRDSENMGRIHRFLGLSVGVILAEMPPVVRRVQYAADITYGTNNEFGFDYLRDNMAWNAADMVQRGHHYAIVDEVDSILIDEARTPLIISGPAEQSARWYQEFARMAPLLKKDVHYEVDERKRTVGVTEDGVAFVEDQLGIDNLYEAANTPLVGYLNNALKVKELYHRDKDYIVREGQVLIVDEFTGRVLVGRRYNEGMHQAIEAKEGVEIQAENQTLATITLQNYFRLYDKLAGMTGTAQTEAAELHQIYKLGVVSIPTNMPMIRKDQADLIYKTEQAKFEAVADDIAEKHTNGQPVLVGTTSVEKSEYLSKLLVQRQIPHEVLNAKQHEREAAIVGAGRARGRGHGRHQHGRPRHRHHAGRQPGLPRRRGAAPPRAGSRRDARGVRGGVGRGPRVDEAAGRGGGRGGRGRGRAVRAGHRAARVAADRQPAPRSLRPSGRPGRVPVLPVARRRADAPVQRRRRRVDHDPAQAAGGRPDRGGHGHQGHPQRPDAGRAAELRDPQERPQVRRGAEQAAHRHLRRAATACSRARTSKSRSRTCSPTSSPRTSTARRPTATPRTGISTSCGPRCAPSTRSGSAGRRSRVDDDEGHVDLTRDAAARGRARRRSRGLRRSARPRSTSSSRCRAGCASWSGRCCCTVMDRKWREHLYEMDYLKEGIGLRAMAQRDPLIEYQREGFDMFSAMMDGIKEETVSLLFHVKVQVVPAEPAPTDAAPAEQDAVAGAEAAAVQAAAAQAAAATPAAGLPVAAPRAPVPAATSPDAETTGVLPAVFRGARASELSYSGPSEDGTATRTGARSGNGRAGTAAKANEPSRNRPCPCGSGRKYKQCHGSPTAARP